MEHSQTYERIVPRQAVGKYLVIRLSVYLAYACFAALWIAPILRSMLSPPLIVLAVISTLTVILLTRKYLHVEFEYSFVADTLTLSKIYGKRRRKHMLTVELRSLLLVAPATEEYEAQAEHLCPEQTVLALSAPDSDNALLAVFENEDKQRVLLYLESDERTLAILRRFCPQACAKEIRFR